MDHYLQNFASNVKTSIQPAAALVRDLKQRGMLKDTLVVCGGEFELVPYTRKKAHKEITMDVITTEEPFQCGWLVAVQSGIEYGKTDDFAYNILENPVHISDFFQSFIALVSTMNALPTAIKAWTNDSLESKVHTLLDILGDVNPWKSAREA